MKTSELAHLRAESALREPLPVIDLTPLPDEDPTEVAEDEVNEYMRALALIDNFQSLIVRLEGVKMDPTSRGMLVGMKRAITNFMVGD